MGPLRSYTWVPLVAATSKGLVLQLASYGLICFVYALRYAFLAYYTARIASCTPSKGISSVFNEDVPLHVFPNLASD